MTASDLPDRATAAEPFADRPGWGWQRCTPQLLRETSANCGEIGRRPAADGQGHEHLVFVGATEPFADRDRWYPMLAIVEEVHPDAISLAGENWRTWIENVIGIDEHGCLVEEIGPNVMVLVGRRTGLPSRHNNYWSVAVGAEPFDIAIQTGEPDGFLMPEELRDAWLDAVAVAESRNQRAEA